MFTGVIEAQGTVSAVTAQRRGHRLAVTVPRFVSRARRGESLAVNGVCLSVVMRRDRALIFDVVPETLRRTTLGRLRAGDRVNLERPLRAGGRVHGHLVLGHVDGTARIAAIAPTGRERWIDLSVPRRLAGYCVPKGSLAVDGVSLTIGRVLKQRVRLYLIPTTLRRTTLGHVRVGDHVNLEADFLVKAALQ